MPQTLRLNQLLDFLQTIEKMKTVTRQMYTSNPSRRESDAEHVWHLVMFVYLFNSDLDQKLDLLKMIKISLIHDLVEIYAGDTFAFSPVAKLTQKATESQAAKKLFAQLPMDLNEEFSQLFNEYEENLTPEAKAVKSFDKLQPILQNLSSQGKSWQEHHLKLSEVDKNKRAFMSHNPVILELFEILLSRAKSSGFIDL